MENDIEERRATIFLHPAVMEYRLKMLEEGHKDLKDMMREGFAEIKKSSSKTWAAVPAWIAAAAAIAATFATLHRG